MERNALQRHRHKQARGLGSAKIPHIFIGGTWDGRIVGADEPLPPIWHVPVPEDWPCEFNPHEGVGTEATVRCETYKRSPFRCDDAELGLYIPEKWSNMDGINHLLTEYTRMKRDEQRRSY